MSAPVEAREPSARYLAARQPAVVEHFERLATAPGGVARLRELILTLAIQGRLTPRNSTGFARVTGAMVEDGAPFDLPEDWFWSKLGSLQPEFQNGASSRGDPGGQPIAVLRLADIKERRVSLAETREVPIRRQDIEKYRLRDGDILITRVNGSADLVGQFNLVEGEPNAIYCDHFIRMRVSRDVLDPKYLALFGGSDFIRVRISNLFISTAGQKTVNQSHIASLPIAIPPLDEQARIVVRVDELMRLCDDLEAKGRLEAEQHARLLGTLLGTLTDCTTPEELAANWQRVAEHFDLLLDRPEAVDALEKTVLQLAVRGLLVPQNSGDEQDNISPMRDATPYDAPRGWTWTTIDAIAKVGTGTTPSRENPAYFVGGTTPWVTSGETDQSFINRTAQYVTDLALANTSLSVYPVGTLIVAMYGQGKTRGQISELCIPAATNQACAAIVLTEDAPAHRSFIKLVFEKSYDEIRELSAGGAQPNLNLSKVKATLIPLPPLAEQHRIVTRVTELRRLCADLRQRLAAAQSLQSALANALVEQATA